MRKLRVFNHVSLDGFICDAHGDMSWAHKRADAEWNAFTTENASGGGAAMLFGRVTYQMMESFWPTEAAKQAMPKVAATMNDAHKIVFSKTLEKASWSNTTIVRSDLPAEVRRLKEQPGPDLLVMGSGSLVPPLVDARLVDELQVIVNPVALGAGKAMFAALKTPAEWKLEKTRAFQNGNVVLWYAPSR